MKTSVVYKVPYNFRRVNPNIGEDEYLKKNCKKSIYKKCIENWDSVWLMVFKEAENYHTKLLMDINTFKLMVIRKASYKHTYVEWMNNNFNLKENNHLDFPYRMIRNRLHKSLKVMNSRLIDKNTEEYEYYLLTLGGGNDALVDLRIKQIYL